MSLVSFYSQEELEGLGLRHLGRDVRISRMARLYNPAGLAIGDHSRIDDFCILTGDIFIGRNVHVSAFGALHGSQGIRLEDFSCVSGRVSIYTESDDYTSGQCLTNATVPEPFRHIEDKGPVRVARHGLVGCGSVLLPGTTVRRPFAFAHERG